MQSHSHGLEQRSIFKGQTIRESVYDAGGNRNKLSKRTGTAVITAGHTEYLTAIAEIDIATKTVCARAAIDRGVERDAVADREVLDFT